MRLLSTLVALPSAAAFRAGLMLQASAPLAARSVSMSTTTTSAVQDYAQLKKLLKEVSALSEVEGVLSYDEQVFMPAGAAESRSAQKAALAKVLHEKRTGAEMRAAIDAVRGIELDDPRQRANVRDAIEDFDKSARKSVELAEREARLESEAFVAWKDARAAADFSMFAPKLVEMFELKKQVAAVTRPSLCETDPYDGALDAFERGMRAERLDAIFGELREGLVPLLEAILAKKRSTPEVDAPHPALVHGPQWDPEAQTALSREVAGKLGFSFENGRLDVSTHPFTGGAGPRDVRMTTRYSDNWEEGFGATIHETGHALYEQALPPPPPPPDLAPDIDPSLRPQPCAPQLPAATPRTPAPGRTPDGPRAARAGARPGRRQRRAAVLGRAEHGGARVAVAAVGADGAAVTRLLEVRDAALPRALPLHQGGERRGLLPHVQPRRAGLHPRGGGRGHVPAARHPALRHRAQQLVQVPPALSAPPASLHQLTAQAAPTRPT